VDPRLLELERKVTAEILKEINAPFEIRMSTAGFCPRQMDYDYQRGKHKVDVKSALRFEMGDVFHTYWQDLLSRTFGDQFRAVEKELEVELLLAPGDDTLKVIGHCDGELLPYDALVEVKSVSDNTFIMVQNQGTPLASHYEQGNIYAHANGNKWILFIYQNRDTGEFYFILAPYNPELADQTMKKWAGVEMRARAGVMIDRPYHDASESPCWFCNWKDECYANFKNEVAAMAVIEVTDPALMQAADLFKVHRRGRLNHTKLEELQKAEIARHMTQMKIKEAKVPLVGTLTLKVCKNNNPLVDLKELKDDQPST
jgi:hypothetical protein